MLWNITLKSKLEAAAFKPLAADGCVYIRVIKEEVSLLIVYVDDVIWVAEDLRWLFGKWIRDPQHPDHPISWTKHGTQQTKSSNFYLTKIHHSESAREIRDGRVYTSPNPHWPQCPPHCVYGASERGRETGYDEGSVKVSSWISFISCKCHTSRHYVLRMSSSEVLFQLATSALESSKENNGLLAWRHRRRSTVLWRRRLRWRFRQPRINARQHLFLPRWSGVLGQSTKKYDCSINNSEWVSSTGRSVQRRGLAEQV